MKTCRFDDSGGCSFSHELSSEYNQSILKRHDLDGLNRKELCVLLLQNDNQMLPPVSMNMHGGSRKRHPGICIFSFTSTESPVVSCLLKQICHDYNNGPGMFGLCQAGYGCKRVHICERFLNRDCRCSRNHDFRAAQRRQVLQDIPEHFIHFLKPAYANIQAMKYHFNKGKHQGNSGNDAVETTWNRSGAKAAESSNSHNKTQNPEGTSDGRGDSNGSY